MAARSAEVKSYVLPDVKSKAAAVYARWGMSLSDAVNTFLIKSIEVGGLPFDMRPATVRASFQQRWMTRKATSMTVSSASSRPVPWEIWLAYVRFADHPDVGKIAMP